MLRKSELSDPVRVGMLRPSLFKTQVVGSAGSSSGGSSGDDLTKPSSTADPGNIFLKVFDEEDGNESKREATAEEKKEVSHLCARNRRQASNWIRSKVIFDMAGNGSPIVSYYIYVNTY